MQAEEEEGGWRRGCRADEGLGRLGWGYKRGGSDGGTTRGWVTDEVPGGFIHQTGG